MDEQSTEPRKRAVIISVIFSTVVLGYIAYAGIMRRTALSDETRYTIGYTIEFQLTAAGRDVKYGYTVNGKTYEDVATYAYAAQVPGGRYFVKFSVRHPEISELFQNYPVPESVKLSPPEGWKKLPIRN